MKPYAIKVKVAPVLPALVSVVTRLNAGLIGTRSEPIREKTFVMRAAVSTYLILQRHDLTRVFCKCNMIDLTPEFIALISVAKLNTLSFHLGTTAKGKKRAAGEDQSEGVFHGAIC